MSPLFRTSWCTRSTFAVAAAVGSVTALLGCSRADGAPSSSAPEVPGVGTWTALRAQSTGTEQAAWNGSELFLWGHARGGRYSLARDEWIPATTEGEPGVRAEQYELGILRASLVWLDSERVLLWGGLGCGPIQSESCADGFVYDAARDAWSKLDAESPPIGRYAHSTVWTGDRMIVWGGVNLDASLQLRPLADGAIYEPASNRWYPMSTLGAPSRRGEHTAVWTGTKMIVWGGWVHDASSPMVPEDGAVYDLASDTWTPMTRMGAPPACAAQTAVWTGTEMLVWGGDRLKEESVPPTSVLCEGGAAYDPMLDRWRTISVKNAPDARVGHTAVWTGSRMIVWGGAAVEGREFSDGALYDPVSDTWERMTTTGAPQARIGHAAFWTGSQMLVWGGGTTQFAGGYGDGALYTP